MRTFFRNNSLSIALFALFALSILGHMLAGWKVENEELHEHGKAALSLGQYLADPSFWSSVFENWESEFLQMGTYVVLTAYLVQRGSAESRDPDEPARDGDSVGRWFHNHSLGTVMGVLFVVAFVLHWHFSAGAAAEEARMKGEPAVGMIGFLAEPQMWFESFQNWQSEFLSTGVLVLLSIVLRQKNSPESKPVDAPNSKTGAD